MVEKALALSIRKGAVARAGRLQVRQGGLDRQPVAEEGRAPVVSSQRHDDDLRRPWRVELVGQGPSKFEGWGAEHSAGFRSVPGAIVRRSAFVAPGVVLMPSFVNLGAYVDSGTMVDTWATVGSCAQIGKNVHLSGGVGIGGVLEPLQAGPDHHRRRLFHRRAFGGRRRRGRRPGFGARHGRLHRRVDQGHRPRDRQDHIGYVPPYSVVVSGNVPAKALPGENWGPSTYCAVIVKTVDAQTRSKTGINELLRD